MEVANAGNIAEIPLFRLEDCIGGASFYIGEMKGNEDVCEEMGIPHRHNGYSIDILVSGTIRQSIDFKQYEVTAPAVMLMEPDQVHQHEMAEDAELINIYFSNDFLVPEMQGVVSCWRCVFNSGVIPLNEEQMDELMSYARLIKKEYESDRLRKDAVIRNLLNAFVIACGRIAEPPTGWLNAESSQYNMARQFKVLVDQHFHQKAQVSDYAEMLFVTPGHLNDTVKSLLGRNAKHVIDEKRIMEAKRLLYWGEHSVKQIAARLNFEDDAYFNRFFKKHTGVTPATFQRTTREKYN
ncbi:MAG TPA: helix-turn-helix domain-containing protein [Chitinophaga sp.]|uniref:helix-turn-helix domain-containing protein n=1 Tax=Chitinophaga sp. TaxID=1869181 RepID=UPI002C258901|nr:helix-turn-helix domain-containing protein [Chitinophaga sp.]HVI45810.1 helix-turn-helix domain-containing protein [Chitinophaga sp.]